MINTNTQNSIIEIRETLADLEYDILLLESELKNCENQELGERLFNELCEAKVKLAKLYDTGFNA